jgi:hypothetical protein
MIIKPKSQQSKCSIKFGCNRTKPDMGKCAEPVIQECGKMASIFSNFPRYAVFQPWPHFPISGAVAFSE